MHSGAGLGTELASGVGCWLAQSGTENQNPDFPIFSYASYKDEIVRDFELDLTKDEDKDFLDDVIRYLDEKESDEAHEKAEKLIGDGWSCTSAREEVADTLDMDINDPDTQDFLDRVYEEMRNVDKDKKRIVKNRGHDLLRYGRCRRYPDDGRSGS